MHHEGRRALTQSRAMPCPTGRGSAACGEASKCNHRCTPMNTDGPEAVMVVHGRDRAPGPGEPRRCGGPCPIGVYRCASAVAISCLLPCVPDPAARTAGRRAHARTPCTCTDCRQPSHRRSHRRGRHCARRGRTPCTCTRPRRPTTRHGLGCSHGDRTPCTCAIAALCSKRHKGSSSPRKWGPMRLRRRPEIVEPLGVQTAFHVIPAKAGT
jgi:hypothetical protein